MSQVGTRRGTLLLGLLLAWPGLVLAQTTTTSTSTTTSTVPFGYGAGHLNDEPEAFYSNSTLYQIDITTGVATSIGPIGAASVSGMDFHPTTDVLYATGFRLSDLPNTLTSILLTIDPATGVGTEIGPTGIEDSGINEFNCAGLSFRSDGTLFCYAEGGDDLVTLDTSTGAATLVGDTFASCCGNGIAFASDDTLFHINESELQTLNQSTGLAATVAQMTYPPGPLPSFDFWRINSADFSPSQTLLGSLERGFKGEPGGAGLHTFLAGVTNAGVVDCIGPTALGLDAFAVAPGVDVTGVTPGDCALPTCELTTGDLQGSQVQWTIQDTGSGLDQVNVLQATNATVMVPAFSSGETSPVMVTADADGPGLATVQLEAVDVAGNVTTCEVVDFNVDNTPPTCAVLIDKTSNEPVIFRVQDTLSGVMTIAQVIGGNAAVTIPMFMSGTTTPIDVPARQLLADTPSAIRIRVVDVQGNQTFCEKVNFHVLSQNGNGTTRITFGGIDVEQDTVGFFNMTPGYDRARLRIGRFQSRFDLADGGNAFVNIAGGLAPGANDVKMQAWGKGGPSMLVTFSATTPGAP